ncbi:hypothetical protein [Natronolimnobius baerhuensis]|uniref:Uncharacterized protein n=1 Tax=Natronolimnobius baerhuensis TaxID=253108 RepID=A0A202EDZ7_9EURY|nr:hypothetical protein [Natronolimnobius baerhuensis]OVE86445.1 hypothetical protein B2G88_04615 [Natronolimnobius baerhuensis]
MTDDHDSETDPDVEYHLREALQHLGAASEADDLRKTNAVALEDVSRTVSSVLREYEHDE